MILNSKTRSMLLCAFVAAAAIAGDEMAPKNCNCDNYWLSWSPTTGGIPRTCASLAIYAMIQQGKCMMSMDGLDSSCPTTYKCEIGNPSVAPAFSVSCVFTVKTRDANGNCTGEDIVYPYFNETCHVSSPAENPDSGCQTIARLPMSADSGT